MTTKPTPIIGYREISENQRELANCMKEIEEALLRLVDLHKAAPQVFDPRWTAVAQTHFQEGFMAINRANFQPQRAGGHIDLSTAFDAAEMKLVELTQ